MDSDTARGSVTDSSDHTSSSRFLDHFWSLNARYYRVRDVLAVPGIAF